LITPLLIFHYAIDAIIAIIDDDDIDAITPLHYYIDIDIDDALH
jgi:hypothetical protein